MNLKLYFFFLFTILGAELTFAQNEELNIRVIEDGDEIELPDSVRRTIQADSTLTYPSLLKWYTTRGFLKADIDSISNKEYQVKPGCLFNISQMNVLYTGEIDSARTLKNRGDFTQKNIEHEILQLIFELEKQGFPFAKSQIIAFNPDYSNCTVSVDLEIETGEQVVASHIYFSGAKSNSQEYLRKISRFKDSVYVTPAYLSSLKSNLNVSELFSSVDDAQLFTRDGRPLIIFQVEERTLNQFDGLLGYVPNSDGKGQIVGDAELSLWNVLMQGNGFNFKYQRLKPERSKLGLGISQIWFGNIPVGITGRFQLEQNDTTYQARNFMLDAFYQLESGIRLTGGIEYQTTTSGNNLPKIVEPDGRKQIARFGFEFSNLDNYEIPTSGTSLMVNLAVVNKDLDDDSTGSFIQNTLHFEARNYMSFLKRSVITPSVHVFFLDADKVTINDLIWFGGANSFRGYAEEQFRAGTMVWGDLEYRYLLNNYSYLFAFGAAGGYERPKLLTESDNTFQVVDYLYSAGFGLSYRTAIGQIRFTYAVSPEESLENGKIHFGISTSL